MESTVKGLKRQLDWIVECVQLSRPSNATLTCDLLDWSLSSPEWKLRRRLNPPADFAADALAVADAAAAFAASTPILERFCLGLMLMRCVARSIRSCLVLLKSISDAETISDEAMNICGGISVHKAHSSEEDRAISSVFHGSIFKYLTRLITLRLKPISEMLPIWEAGAPDTVSDSAASFHFLADGNLQLVNGSGVVLWESNTTGLGVSSANIDDTGNFALQVNGSSSGSVWSTFDHPTDTIVTNQNFTTGMTLGSGLYSFTLTPVGDLTLKWNDSIIYWTLGLNSTINRNLSEPRIMLESIGKLLLFDATLNTSVIMAYSSDYAGSGDFIRVLKLEGDGNLKILSSPSGNGSTTVSWIAVSDQCEVYGYCGNMGICSYNDTDPICSCPSENFTPVDSRDSRKGCKRNVALNNCDQNQTGILVLDNTQFFTYPPETTTDSFLAADGSGQCFFKTENFISGYQSATIPSTSFVKICGAAVPNPPAASPETRKVGKLRGWIIAVVVLCTILGLLLVESGLWWWCIGKTRGFGTFSTQYALLEYASGAPVQFSFRELQRATKGFKEKLGEGGFGAVYRAVLTNKTVAAVKQLEGIEQGEKQFRMEVATISSTHHLNLVRLIGFCSEGRHRLLVYEFMKNSSLDSFLFSTDEGHGKLLNWEHRFNIALGTARGITYLHEECRDCIVHCDIKPENILIDENYNAKVSDFGLAKLINAKDHRRTLTSVRGTRGYLAPEWLSNLPITSKSDVYSYGMVLLEIVSGRRNFDVSAETNGKKFSSWVYDEVEKGNLDGIVDKRLAEADVDMDQVARAIKVSFWCIQEQPSQRPMMGRVVQILEGILEIERPPVPKVAPESSFVGGTCSSYVSANVFSLAASVPAASSSSSLGTRSQQVPMNKSSTHSTTKENKEICSCGRRTPPSITFMIKIFPDISSKQDDVHRLNGLDGRWSSA
ncbi:G-type lectin S-receptor-like serine/threonine-protein kinase-like protein, partial [Drosera capensis]